MEIKKSLKTIFTEGLRFAAPGEEFTLASGGKSKILLDLSYPLRTTAGVGAIGSDISRVFKGAFYEYDTVGGPLNGSDLISSILLNKGWIQKSFGIRKEEKGRGLEVGLVTGNLDYGDKILLVEDVITTGSSLIRAGLEAQKYGHVMGILCAVVRDEKVIPNIERIFGCRVQYLATLSDLLMEVEQ